MHGRTNVVIPSVIAHHWTITHLRDDLDLMREVTCLLNDTTQIKSFKDLAKECGISPEIYNSLQPPCAESPTKEVLEDIVGRYPLYTVDELFLDLHKINRLDVVEAIGRHFIGIKCADAPSLRDIWWGCVPW